MSETQEACGSHVHRIKTTGTLTRGRVVVPSRMPFELSVERKAQGPRTRTKLTEGFHGSAILCLTQCLLRSV